MTKTEGIQIIYNTALPSDIKYRFSQLLFSAKPERREEVIKKMRELEKEYYSKKIQHQKQKESFEEKEATKIMSRGKREIIHFYNS